MHVWITPQLNSHFFIKDLPLRLLPQNELRSAFLEQCAPGDVAIIPFDDEYLAFLTVAKSKGIANLILFISPEPTITVADLQGFNALVLDIKNIGEGAVKQIIRIILELAAGKSEHAVPGIIYDIKTPGVTREKPVDDLAVILEQLSYICKKDVPVMIAMEMRESSQLVTARGLCMIKEVRSDAIVYHKFKLPQFCSEMKTGQSIMLHYAYKQTNNSFIVVVKKTTDNELFTSVPTELFPTRGFRIQPNQSKPISLYIHIANEPTTDYKVLDISIRGIGFMCTRDLALDTAHSFTIILPEPQTVIVTIGIVRFKKETSQGIRYGAELRLHSWDEEHIAKYIMKREAETMALLRAKF